MATILDSICAQFRRFWLDDPVLQAMERGDIMWGDIQMTKEEIAFHNEWAMRNKPIVCPVPKAPSTSRSEAVIIPVAPEAADEEDGWTLMTKKPAAPAALAALAAVVPGVSVPMGMVMGIKTLIARNLPRSITVEMLRSVFEKFGPVKDIYIPRNMDKTSPLYGTVKGFALVKFLKPTDSAAAYRALFGTLTLASNHISIEFAKEDR